MKIKQKLKCVEINMAVFRLQSDEHAKNMKRNAIRRAPKDTGKLKAYGIKAKSIANGTAVYLDMESVDYGVFQELGWNTGKTTKPGKFFMESSFLFECAKAGIDGQKMLKKSLKVKGTNGRKIVKYVKWGGSPIQIED